MADTFFLLLETVTTLEKPPEAQTLDAQVMQFVAHYLRVNPNGVRPETQLGSHLGVDGDDGLEFMQAFGERFGVDLSAFNPSAHFGPEGICDPLRLLWEWMTHDGVSCLMPITVQQLTKAAHSKAW